MGSWRSTDDNRLPEDWPKGKMKPIPDNLHEVMGFELEEVEDWFRLLITKKTADAELTNKRNNHAFNTFVKKKEEEYEDEVHSTQSRS